MGKLQNAFHESKLFVRWICISHLAVKLPEVMGVGRGCPSGFWNL